ncbi:Probable NreB protein [Polaromonas sp. CG9_12]|nr:Probable NreB protein [Polaromonas sp. CG9_12]
MLGIFTNRTYRHLFAAQVIALIGTGLATVALGLLAFDLAGNNAGVVLGTALAIKMIAYVGAAPITAAFAERLPRRTMLVTLDLVRAGVALLLPFVTQIWEIYLLIFVLQAASAAFTPTFQATIPDVLPQEEDYTKALSLSRLAYDMESLVSPMLAAALLTVIGFHDVFAATVVGFLASAMLVVSVVLPVHPAPQRRGIYDRTTRGLHGSCAGFANRAGQAGRPQRDAGRHRVAGRGHVRWHVAERTRRAPGLVVRAGFGLLHRPDTLRALVAAILESGRSPCAVCRAVCVVSCQLAVVLSLGRMAGC